jgi:hypothetical protein
MPRLWVNATSDNKQLHLFYIKCCKMGKGGVLWGRLVMKNQSTHNVIHRRNTTIYRRKAANICTNRYAGRFFVGFYVCVSGINRCYLAFTRARVREEGQCDGADPVSRRECDGVRTDSFLSIKKNRNRQAGQDPITRIASRVCGTDRTCSRSWSRGSCRSNERTTMGGDKSQAFQVARIYGKSKRTSKKGFRSMMPSKQISLTEQGRSVRKGACVTDDASTLHEIYAASAASFEPRTALPRESTSKDARY